MGVKSKEYFESFSNLAYNLAGLAALYFHGDVLFCFALQALGAASFVYHYHKTSDRSQNIIWMFDWWAMTFLVTILTGMIADNSTVWYLVVLYQIIYSYFIIGRLNVFVEVGIAVAPCLLTILICRPISTFLVVAGIFVFAVWIRSKDEDPKQLKFHDSVWHSFWHILTAVGFYIAAYL